MCTRSDDWIYARLDGDEGVISTVVVVSDWRNSLGSLDTTGQPKAKLFLGFAEQDPSSQLSQSIPTAMWKELGYDYHSQVVDLTPSEVMWGNYVVLRVNCPSSNCVQTRIYSVRLSKWKLMDANSYSWNKRNIA